SARSVDRPRRRRGPGTVHRAAGCPGSEAWRGKKLSGVIATVSAAPGGSAATRIEIFVLSTAPYASGGYPDIDDLFRQQAQERDRKKREALLLRGDPSKEA